MHKFIILKTDYDYRILLLNVDSDMCTETGTIFTSQSRAIDYVDWCNRQVDED